MENIVHISESDVAIFDSPPSKKLHEIFKYYIFDQKKINCCAVASVISLIEYLRQKEGKDLEKFSVSFLYHNSLLMQGVLRNVPLRTRCVINAIMSAGVCKQERWSSSNDFREKPSDEAIRDALSRVEHCNIEDIDKSLKTIKYIIGFCERPIVAIFLAFEHNSLSLSRSKEIIKLPSDRTFVYDRHSILLVGYDDDERVIYFQNSYGEEWGNGGFGRISYDYIPYFDLLYTMDQSCIKGEI